MRRTGHVIVFLLFAAVLFSGKNAPTPAAQNPHANRTAGTTPGRLHSIRIEDLNLANGDQEWGNMRPFQSVTGNDLVVAGRKAEHGIGMHARGELSVDLMGTARRFRAAVGVDDAAGDKASVVFRVLVDGRTVFDSGTMRKGMAAKPVDVDLVAARELSLLVDDAGDGNDDDHADWLDAAIDSADGSPEPASVAAHHLRIRPSTDVELSGMVTLPAGRLAPPGGVKVWLTVHDEERKPVAWPRFLIPPGVNSVAWAHRVPRREDQGRKFYLQYGVGGEYLPNAWWSRGGMRVQADDADKVDASSGRAGNVRVDVLDGLVLSGTVTLPPGTKAPAGGRQVWIDVQNARRAWVAGTSITIPAGQSSGSWMRVYPRDQENFGQAYVRYGIVDDECVKWAWWTPAGMKEDWNQAAPLALTGGRRDGIALTVLPVRFADSRAPAGAVFLDGMNLSFVKTGWGKVFARRSCQDLALSIGGERFRHGIGMHAAGEFTVDLKGTATRFRARLGVDDEVKTGGSVVFRVYVDGAQVLETPVMRGGMRARNIDLDLAGAKTLRVVAEPTADGIGADHADVADAFLELVPGATERPAMRDPDTAAAPQTTWLEDLDTSTIRQGWGAPQSGRNLNLDPLKCAGRSYRHGVATHAASTWILDLAGRGERFRALVGIDDSAKGNGSVVFTIRGDERTLFESPVLKGGDKPLPVDVDLSGVRTLSLLVRDGGDNWYNDQADWLDARLVMRPGAAPPRAVPADRPRADAWRVTYWTNETLSSAPALVRVTGPGALHLPFGWGGPEAGMPTDHFSLRATRWLETDTDGLWIFSLFCDDGARLRVDGRIVHDDWQPQAASWKRVPVRLAKGRHEVTLEYFEAGGWATCQLDLERHTPLADGAQLAGTLRLPAGTRAPAGGLPVAVYAVDEGTKLEYFSPVNIPAGATGAPFEVRVPRAVAGHRFHLRYRLEHDRLLPEGYYAATGPEWRPHARTPVTPGAAGTRGLLLSLGAGVRLAGEVRLPDGMVAPDGGALVSLRSYVVEGGYSTQASVSIPGGATGARFSMLFPPVADGITHYVCYKTALPGVFPEIPWDINNSTAMMTVVRLKTADVTNATVRLFAERTITGTVSLPAGQVAPADGMRILVRGLFKEHSQVFDHNVVIPEGQRSAPYRLVVPVFTDDHKRLAVRYSQWYAGYKRAAYRGRHGMIPFGNFPVDRWVDLSVRSAAGVDLELVPDATVLSYDDEERRAQARAREIVARVTRPHWTEFEKAIALYDWFADNVVYYSDTWAVKRRFPVLEAVWTLHAPVWYGVTVCGGYTSSYSHLARLARLETSARGNNGHVWNLVKVNNRWYQSDATSQPNYRIFLLSGPQMLAAGNRHDRAARPTADEPFLFNAARDYPNLKEMRQPSYRRLMGNVRLPAGDVAPAGGLWISVLGQWRWIPEGKSATSWFYRANLNAHPSGKLVVECTENSGRYRQRCFWSANGTVTEPERATMVPLAGDDVVGLDITLQSTAAAVSGRVLLPGGATAPAGGVAVRVVGLDAKGAALAWGDVKIAEDKASVDYRLVLPAGTKAVRVKYETQASGWAGRGFAGTVGTVPDLEDAVERPLPARVDLMLLPGTRIGGEIRLPAGDAPRAEEFWISVALVVGDAHVQWKWFRFPAGTRAIPWEMHVATNGRIAHLGFRLRSEMAASRYAVLWWNKTGGHQDQGRAEFGRLDGPAARHDFALQAGRPVSGTIRLPAGRVAPAGGLAVTVGWYERRGTGSIRWWWITPTIPGGASSVDYFLLLPWPGPNASSYRFYVAPRADGWKKEIFWTPAGSVADLARAVELPIDRKEYRTIDFTLLPE